MTRCFTSRSTLSPGELNSAFAEFLYVAARYPHCLSRHKAKPACAEHLCLSRSLNPCTTAVHTTLLQLCLRKKIAVVVLVVVAVMMVIMRCKCVVVVVAVMVSAVVVLCVYFVAVMCPLLRVQCEWFAIDHIIFVVSSQ